MFKKDFLIRLLAQKTAIIEEDPELITENHDQGKVEIRVKKTIDLKEHQKSKIFNCMLYTVAQNKPGTIKVAIIS